MASARGDSPRSLERANDGVVREVILATNFRGSEARRTVSEPWWEGVKVTRIARGLPGGGELEHVDSGTLAQALLERRPA
jgi:recombination protein RecR